MRREEFEHVVAAAAEITGEDEFVIVGSQAILGSYPEQPAPMLRSLEADIYPLHRPEKADAIDGALGVRAAELLARIPALPLTEDARGQIDVTLRGIIASSDRPV